MIKIIGKCRELYNDANLPSIKELISEKPIKHKDTILEYLRSGQKGATAAGTATDLIENKPIPGEFCCYSDGKYGWRSDTIYYFDKYNLKLDDDFIKSIIC